MATRDPWGSRRWRGIGAWWRDHWRIARDSGAFVSARLGTSVLVWLLIGIALALPAGLYLVRANLSLMADQWQGRAGISVYFGPGSEPALGVELQAELEARAEVEVVRLISAERALEDFQAFAGVEDALALLEVNPLPMSLGVVLVEDVEAAEFDLLATQLAERPGVIDVVIERTWLERVDAMNAVLGRLAVVLTVLFSCGAVLVSATSARLAIETRLDELRVMKLVGATDAYIRRPFLYLGVFYGVGGGLLAAMLISGVLVVLEAPLATLFDSYGGQLESGGFDLAFFVSLLIIGGLLGIGGAMLAARQRLAHLEVL
jgi:cell division transport system permease protein